MSQLPPEVVAELLRDWEPTAAERLGLPEEVYQELIRDWVPQVGGAVQEHVQIGEDFQAYVRSLRTYANSFRVQFVNLDNVNIHRFLIDAINHILDIAFRDAGPDDRVGIEIRHPGLDRPILIPFRRRGELDAETVVRVIENVQQSDTNVFTIDDQMVWITNRVEIPTGAGRRNLYPNLNDWLMSKSRSMLKINNNDKLCLARALVTAKAHLHKNDSPNAKREYENLRKGDRNRYTKQKEKARELMAAAGIRDGPCSLEHLSVMHATNLMKDYRIQVFSTESFLARIYDMGTGPILSLLLNDNHFDVLTNVAGFFERGYFCERCGVAYKQKRRHIECGHRCTCCYEVPACTLTQWIKCSDCDRWFFGQNCYDNHKKEKENAVLDPKTNKKKKITTTTCQKVRKCRCGVVVNDKDHECFKTKCNICKEFVEQPHHCFLQVIDETAEPVKTLIFYDMECTQEKVVKQNVTQHEVNFVCATKVSTEDGSEEDKVFKGEDALNEFCNWLFTNKGATAIAHNAKSYDSQFVLDWIHKQASKPQVLLRGLENLSIEHLRVKLIDSLCFLPMALAQFPKSFGFDAAKGYFPHLFNRKENWTVIQQGLPPKEMYGTAGMKADALAEFEKWYEEHKNDEFDMQKEIEKYCKLDVEILKRGCMKFREILLTEHGVDPFACAITIASTCMHIYRYKYAKPAMIGIVPTGGYRKHEQQSIKAIKWLKWISEQEYLDIQHARNGQEIKILNFKVDGQLRSDPKQLYEFNGCIFHGCPHCIKDRTSKLPKSDKTAREAYEDTMNRQQQLEAMGYRVRVLWECELDDMLKTDLEMKEFFDSVQIHEPMNPREGFCGGRCNCRKMYHKCADGETIGYADVCSLYPWVCKYGTFPVGHPTVITENIDIEKREHHGLIKCLVLPPTDLLHPVLPSRCGDKLLFHLCRTCAESRQAELCAHTDEDRQFWGTWATCELYKAMDLGYRVLEVAEIYHYDEWEQYEPDVPGSGLFTGYINAHLKQKQEASGYPAEVKTDDDKLKYIEEYEEHEGIKLNSDKIEKNPGYRSLSKLMLNSFWGKLGQRSNMSKNAYFDGSNAASYFKLFYDPSIEVESIKVVNDSVVRVTYKHTEDYIEDSNNTSSVIASWVTAQARLKLYSYLEKLGDRVLYMDTDSVIYLNRPDDVYQVPLGNYLGDMTDELDGSSISEFVSCGPKQYAFKTLDGKTTVKIRGVTLTADASKQLNFDSMKNIVHTYLSAVDDYAITVKFDQIRKTRDNQLITAATSKRFRVVYDKCRVLADGVCVPYGYR